MAPLLTAEPKQPKQTCPRSFNVNEEQHRVSQSGSCCSICSFHAELVASDAEHKTACKATNFANNESQKQMLLMLQASAALQTFCNSLIHSDVSTLLLEVCEWDAHSFTQWSMYQRAAESLLDLLAMPAVCALADAYGRRPLLLLTGPFELCGWSLLGALVPRTLTAKPLIAFMKAFSSVTNTAFLTVSSSAQFDLLQNQPKELADALAAGQSYVGLAVVGAPLLSILLRRRMGAHAPFWVAGVLSSLVLGAMLTVPETLQTSGRRAIELRKLNPLGSATLLFRQGSNLARLAMMYSIQSVTRCVDAYLHTFMELRLGWGHTQMSKLLSFWGFCVFVGSSLLRKALKHFSARSIVLAGTLFSAADLFFRGLTHRWWHLPAALVLGLPGISVESAMRAMLTNAVRDQCGAALGTAETQAALKMQQTLSCALIGSPLIGQAFASWLRRPRVSSGFVATHYVMASLCSLLAHVLLQSYVPA
mmetsp:Transcript_48543/g.113837  ORF Transcript_48543/g.113837 Transcript_48543/m.113837 type:complete len:478 (+) Transcript_48543:91-1524(+)